MSNSQSPRLPRACHRAHSMSPGLPRACHRAHSMSPRLPRACHSAHSMSPRLSQLHSTVTVLGTCPMVFPKCWGLYCHWVASLTTTTPGLSLGTLTLPLGAKSPILSMTPSILGLLLPLRLPPYSPMASPSLSRWQASAALHDPSMLSKPAPPGGTHIQPSPSSPSNRTPSRSQHINAVFLCIIGHNKPLPRSRGETWMIFHLRMGFLISPLTHTRQVLHHEATLSP